jgi:hypothetical protein
MFCGRILGSLSMGFATFVLQLHLQELFDLLILDLLIMVSKKTLNLNVESVGSTAHDVLGLFCSKD